MRLLAEFGLEPIADTAKTDVARADRTAGLDDFNLDFGLLLRLCMNGPLEHEAVVVAHKGQGHEVANMVWCQVGP